MHLKILIGVLTLGIASASPKASPKPAAKASPQIFSGQEQAYYVPVGANAYGQQISAYSFPGQYSPLAYSTGFAPSSYGYSTGNAGVPLYPQTLAGNYYQQSQLIPVPVSYSSVPSANSVQSASYYGALKLWPKNAVSPTGSPSPAPETPALYYPSSTPSPVSYQSTSNYANPSVSYSVTTPSHVKVQQPQLIPVPVKVDSRNSFHPQITNYNTPKNVHITPASYSTSYQQSTPSPYVQSYQQPTAFHYSAYQKQSGSPYVAQHQQPTVAPYQVSYQQSTLTPHYQQHSTPASFKINYQQSTPTPHQVIYQQSTPSSHQTSYHHSTPAPYQASYQHSTPAPLVSSYFSVSPHTDYQHQSTLSQYQKPTGFSYSGNYQYSEASPFSIKYQQIPVPVGYPNTHFQNQHTKAPTDHVSTAQRSSFSTTTKPVTIQPIPTIPTPVKTVIITEKPFVPISSTPAPFSHAKPTIVKSEYNYGAVSPQYNHVPVGHGLNQQAYSTGAYVAKPTASYLPSTTASHVSYNSPAASYSY